MFFTNLNNNILGLYHNTIFAQDMSLSLTDILNSDLFKVVTHNGLYKIFPLFYCENISCNNSDVKILENKCIITPNITDLFFNFTVDDKNIVIFEDVDLPYKNISDELSTSEFNNYIQLLRQHIQFKDKIHINNGLIEGDYASYMFQLQDVTVVDNGILITQETLDSTATVRLVDPVFTNSHYQLKIDVFSVSDVNILSESSNDNRVTDTLLIDLEEHVDMAIPLTELDFNMIVGFEASIIIKQDKPIILLNKKLDLSISDGHYYIGDQLTLSALYKENNEAAGTGFEVSFYNKNSLLGSEDTDSNGIVSYNYTPESTGQFLFKGIVSNENVSSDILAINVVKKPTVLTLEVSENMVPPGETLLVCGTLKYGDSALSNKNVSLVTSDGDIFRVTTDSNGTFSNDMVFDTTSEVVLHAVFNGDTIYESSNSDFVSVSIGKWSSEFSSVSGSGSINSKSANIQGYLKLNGKVAANTPVDIYNNNTLVDTVNTNSEGYFSKTINNLNAGSYTLTAVYEGTKIYYGSSASIIIPINKIGTTISPQSVFTRDGDYVYADGYLSSSNGILSNKTIAVSRFKYVDGALVDPSVLYVVTDSTGHFMLPFDCTDIRGEGQYVFKVMFFGDDTYSRTPDNAGTSFIF